MDAQAVSRLIANDLRANPTFNNPHGVDVPVCLVVPELLEFEDSFRKGEFLSLWLVLKESPTERDGYLIVYDEASDMFGLAVYGKDRPVFIGFYSSFTKTLSSM